MVTFSFTVNKSFLGSGSRPITIPKSQVDYRSLELEQLVGGATIVCTDGSRRRGKVYCGEAGFGPYYQLRAESAFDDPLGHLLRGEKLRVQLYREGEKVLAVLARSS